MRICFIINNLKIGGAERFLMEKMLRWAKTSGWEPYLVLGSERIEIDICKCCELRDIHVLKSNFIFTRILELSALLKKNRINVCVSHLENSNKITSIASFLAGIPCLSVVHSINIYQQGSMAGFITGLIYNLFCSKVVAVSDSVADYVRRIGVNQKKIEIIENGIDVSVLAKKYEYQPNPERMELLFVGRVEPVKNLPLLLKALKDIDVGGIDWKLNVVGIGSQNEEIRRLAGELGIADKIYFAGQRQDPWEALGSSSVLCFTSLREGLPMALLEGMSLGLPVIASDVGFLPRLITPENGFLFRSGQLDELVAVLKQFSQLPPDRLREMSVASRRIVRSYDIDATVAKYQKTVLGLLRK